MGNDDNDNAAPAVGSSLNAYISTTRLPERESKGFVEEEGD